MSERLDPRLHAYRHDLADIALKDRVQATRFVEGEPAVVGTHFCDVLDRPEPDAGLQTQILHGHDVRVFERQGGWAWVQRIADGYVGYVREDALVPAGVAPTYMVSAPRTFLYSDADLKSPRCGYRSMGSRLKVTDLVETRGTRYALLSTGEAVIAHHLIEIGVWKSDFVSVASTLLHAPYLWGGDTGFGLDCSGLVYLSMMLCGEMVLRDSDMQAASIGSEIAVDGTRFQRGDLVFWKGHVGIMSDEDMLLHANGNTMNVALEALTTAVERIGYLYGSPTGARRP